MVEQENKNSVGPIVGIVIVILMLVIGAFYFYNQRIEKQKETTKTNREQVIVEDVSSLEKTAKSLNFDKLGEGIDQL